MLIRPRAAEPSKHPQGNRNLAFNGRTTSEEIVAGLDLTGRTIVVTGTSTGLGFEAARVLAGAGAEVVMVARDPEKNAKALSRIEAAQPDARLHPVTINLAEMASVRQGAADPRPGRHGDAGRRHPG